MPRLVSEEIHSIVSRRFLRWHAVGMALALLPGFSPAVSGAIIGTNTPAESLTMERIAALPPAQRTAWQEFLERSRRQRQVDQDVLRNELRKRGLGKPIVPPAGNSARSLPLDQPPSWYGSSNAVRIARNIVSFQTPAGGWSKNLNLAMHARVAGESFAPNNDSRWVGRNDFDSPPVGDWDYVGTFDNDATVTELRFLGKVIASAGVKSDPSLRASFERGLEYIFAAQYPNGGWPQVWPLQGGYHDAITYNDNAMVNVLNLLRDVSTGAGEFGFIRQKTRRLAADSLRRGIGCVLATQIIANGHRTAWCQQHDPLTLRPVSARNYEMPSEASSESAGIMMFLMAQPHPGPDLIASVDGAAAWFQKTEIHDAAFRYIPGKGRQRVNAPGHGPIWARYYQIGTDRPIFGDRDKTVHDTLDDISIERRNGYSWFNGLPQEALTRYAGWKAPVTLRSAGFGRQ